MQLEDDKRYFPHYDAAPPIRKEILEKHPEVCRALDELGGLITDDVIRRLNFEVDVERHDAVVVVREWLDANALAAAES